MGSVALDPVDLGPRTLVHREDDAAVLALSGRLSRQSVQGHQRHHGNRDDYENVTSRAALTSTTIHGFPFSPRMASRVGLVDAVHLNLYRPGGRRRFTERGTDVDIGADR